MVNDASFTQAEWFSQRLKKVMKDIHLMKKQYDFKENDES